MGLMMNRAAPYETVEVETPGYVLANDRTKVEGGWADPEFVPVSELKQRFSHTGSLQFNEDGRPVNPEERTGKTGRLLGKWGPNHAADPIILRRNPKSRQLEMIAIQREDTGQWAIPGGMVDGGERISQTLARELKEEAGLELSMEGATRLFEGVVKNDPRNTDNAWMETSVSMLVLDEAQAEQIELSAGSDAIDVQWLPLTAANINSLYADHGRFVDMAVQAVAGEQK